MRPIVVLSLAASLAAALGCTACVPGSAFRPVPSIGSTNSVGATAIRTATAAPLAALLLTTADLPAGYTKVSASPSSSAVLASGCLRRRSPARKFHQAEVIFTGEVSGSVVDEAIILLTPPQAKAIMGRMAVQTRSCRTYVVTFRGVRLTYRLSPLGFVQLGDESQAWTQSISGLGARIDTDVAVIRSGSYLIILSVAAPDGVDTAYFRSIAQTALSKLAA
jgi:hypothetical protein